LEAYPNPERRSQRRAATTATQQLLPQGAVRALRPLLLLVLLPAAGAAQQAETPPDGSSISIALVTMGPGAQVWERFGHNALWVRDTVSGFDRVYNYGMFSFQQERYVQRFLQGLLEYWMMGFESPQHFAAYVAADRSLWIQELNLTPEQRAELAVFLRWNDTPENRYYRYDYYLDNCSTRIRDAIDQVLGGRIRELTANVESGTTFRFHTQRLTAVDVAASTGLLLALGPYVDRPISVWEEMFIPLKLREHVRSITVLDAEGREVPLVSAEYTLYQSTAEPERDAPPFRTHWYLLIGLVLAAAMVAGGLRSDASRAAAVASVSVAGAWAFAAGIAGLVLTGLWFFTDHASAYWNENLFFYNPLALPLVVLIPAMLWRARWAARPAVVLALVVAGLTAVGLLLQPLLPQVNRDLVALATPPNLALAWLALRKGPGSAGAFSSEPPR
jgi:hypothetical protein